MSGSTRRTAGQQHRESFAFEDLAGKAPAPADIEPDGDATATTTYSVEFVRSGARFRCAADETVLDAAYPAGLNPPFSCGQGMCGTCTSTVVSGTVDMQHRRGIRPREIARNRILICCSTPLSDLTIDA